MERVMQIGLGVALFLGLSIGTTGMAETVPLLDSDKKPVRVAPLAPTRSGVKKAKRSKDCGLLYGYGFGNPFFGGYGFGYGYGYGFGYGLGSFYGGCCYPTYYVPSFYYRPFCW